MGTLPFRLLSAPLPTANLGRIFFEREQLFGPLGIKVRPFRDPQGSNRVGLIVETPTWRPGTRRCRRTGHKIGRQPGGGCWEFSLVA